MPTYEYICEACNNEFEKFQQMSAAPVRKCPKCGKNKVQRKISVGGGIIFKGGGFYETDYRNEAYKKAADADKPGESKADVKVDVKADGKTDAAEAKPSDAKPSESKPIEARPANEAKPVATPAPTKPEPKPQASKSAAKRSSKSR